MSKRVNYAQSLPVLSGDASAETDRVVFYAKSDGVYARLAGGTVMGPLAAAGAGPGNMMTTDSTQTGLTGDKTSSGVWTAAAVAAAGLTGAVSATRYVGGTASAAPTTGTFVTGDWVVTQNGKIWICTADGSPGTWTQIQAGQVITSNTSQTGLTGNKTTSGSWDAASYAASGLTGATTATRYAGGTADVAPTSGTFATGAWVVSLTGKIWVCTSGGTPGTWVQVQAAAQDDTTKIAASLVDAKGDLIAATAADTPARLAVGTDGHFLKAASGQSTGLQWAAIAQSDVTNLTSDLAAKAADSAVVHNTGTETVAGAKTFSAATTTVTELAATNVLLDGMANATTNVRLVGGTGGGAPSAGTWAVGDVSVDVTGAVYICTTAGTPGTWRRIGAETIVRDFSKGGVLTTGTGTLRIYAPWAGTIDEVRASVGTAPTGASLIVDVHKNGTTIYGTQSNRPTIAASGFTATGGTASGADFSAGDYFTVDRDQVGSTVAGSDLTVSLLMRRT